MRPAAPGSTDLFTRHYVDHHRDADGLIAERMRETGLVTVDGLVTREAVLAFARRIMDITAHRDSDPDGLTVIRDTGRHAHRPGFAGLGSGELTPHTDGSGLPRPPRLLLLVCAQQAKAGGTPLVADGLAAHQELMARRPDAVAALSEPRTAYFGGADGHLAQVFTAVGDRRVAIRLRWDGLVRWSPLVHPYLPFLRAAIVRHLQPLPLQAGAGYLLDNQRWLHARTAFTGPRRYYRCLGESRFALPCGFHTAQSATSPLARLEAVT